MAAPTAAAVFLPGLWRRVYFVARSTSDTTAPPVPAPLIRVRLPVADPRPPLHQRRALRDVHPARDVAPARVGPAPAVRPPWPAPQVPPELAARPAVGVDVPVYPLAPRHRMALKAQPPGDPRRAPALRQPPLHQRPQLRRHLPGNRRGRAAPPLRPALRPGVALAPGSAVAPDPERDR